MRPICVPSLETSKLLMISLTKFKTFLNVPGPFFSILPDPSIINPRSALALHSTTREEQWNHGVQLRNMLPINNLQFSFPNLINFLKLSECALSIDSECYCLMSDFFCSIQLLLGCSRDLSINQSFSFQFTNYLG